jgi:CYTH domain-containing protein
MNAPFQTHAAQAPVDSPKYARFEIERRWLVEPAALALLEGKPFAQIEDLYVGDTQLRLRRLTSAEGETVYKFCKKYGKRTALSEPITNLYLSEAEHRLLSALQGQAVCKRRYPLAGGSVDVYPGPDSVAIFEIEFASEDEARRYTPPQFVGREITGDVAYSGAALAQRVAP